MTYEIALEKLKAAHFYPVVNKDKDSKQELITGLQIACNSLTWESRKEAVEKVLGSGWVITWMGSNHNCLLITKK